MDIAFLVRPVITDFIVPQRVRAGDRFTISCKGSGNPKPLATWRRNSTTPLQIDGSRISENGTDVVIAQARSSDSGRYECILANLVSSATRSSSLIVQGKMPFSQRYTKIGGIHKGYPHLMGEMELATLRRNTDSGREGV